MNDAHANDHPTQPAPAPRRRSPVMVLGILAVAALVIASAAATGLILAKANAPAPPGVAGLDAETEANLREFYAGLEIPRFELTDQDGDAITNEIFSGKRTILAFSFTNCPMICPLMHSHLIRLVAEGLPAGVRIVTISVDPANDTPEALKTYLDKLGVDQSRWRYLTGDADLASALKLGLNTDASEMIPMKDGSGGTMANIDHPTKLILVGPKGGIEWMSDGLTWQGAQEIARLASELNAR